MIRKKHRAQPLALDLAAYRDLIHLDEPFDAPSPIGQDEREALVARLVAQLAAERSDVSGDTTGLSHDESRFLLHALLTVRPPGTLPEGFVPSMDRLLQRELREKDVVAARALPRMAQAFPSTPYAAASQTALWQGDITALAVDAIVNAANAQLLGCFQPNHRCIDNVIHDAAGPQVRQDCHAIMQRQGHSEGTGQAKVMTRGYNLPARHILHTVGPIVQGELMPWHREQLARSYRACLDLAARVEGIRLVAFCCISTGLFGFPQDAAARIALDTVATWLDDHPGALDLVVFNVFRDDDLDIYRNLLNP